jgi:hypothetical protein
MREPVPETAATTAAPGSSTSAPKPTPVDINTFIQRLQDCEDDLRRQFPLCNSKPDVATASSVIPSKHKGTMSIDESVDHD